MKLGILFSGGKDSTLATYIIAAQYPEHEIICLLSMQSKNKESYMFHTPNISLVELQAEAMEMPVLLQETAGEKEQELKDLRRLLDSAKKKYSIGGVVTGAIESVYQASRVQKICLELGLWCFNPLWQLPQNKVLEEITKNDFEVIITAVAAYPFDDTWLGKTLDMQTIKQLKELQKNYGIHSAGEGGEFETFVVNCPLFTRSIDIVAARKNYKNHAGTYIIEEARLI